jgi:hypothetical protein
VQYVFYEYHEIGVPLFVTVSGILPHFGADRVGDGTLATTNGFRYYETFVSGFNGVGVRLAPLDY